jgi:hypothetical protein
MARTVRDWRLELVEAHPNLFHPLGPHPEAAGGYPTCGDGWRDLLERACVRIEAALADAEASEGTAARVEEVGSACTCENLRRGRSAVRRITTSRTLLPLLRFRVS